MKTPRHLLTERFAEAFNAAFPDQSPPSGDPIVPTAQAEHGDYQCNVALPLARQLKSKPRDVATRLLEHLRVDDICAAPEIAGPGFINLRLRAEFVATQVEQRVADARLGVDVAERPRTIVVDYSSPNVAKPMHVGHIRSTVLGNAIARALRFLGHHVITDNHIGDWGTQFGMLILGWKEMADEEALKNDAVAELKRIYRIVNRKAQEDPVYKERARQEVVTLQAGDPDQLRIWHEIIDASSHVAREVYDRLGVQFDVWHGESFYNAMLPAVVEDLKARGIARDDQGAVAVVFDGPDDPPELRDKVCNIRKSDGAFLYATSDLATVKYRVDTWHPDEMVYFVDGRQQDHFRQFFTIARKWGYTNVKLEHAWFGTIQGEDKKPFKTRDGEVPELMALLDEAEARALAVVQEKQPDMPLEEQREVARVVGLGAVKYSDLAQNRTSDYVFSWDRMLALSGNTAPYMQFAYARINSIAAKAGVNPESLRGPVCLQHGEEIKLAKVALRFGDALEEMIATYRPNVLTTYLFELAQQFSTFVESCPGIIHAEEPLRTSRLTLCQFVARTLAKGLELLGIETLPRM